MAGRLIELEDGTLVEIEIPYGQAEQISGGMPSKVSASLEKITPILINVTKPLTNAWKEISQDMRIEKAEIELGFSFETEGNIYITKAKGGANLVVKLILAPKGRKLKKNPKEQP